MPFSREELQRGFASTFLDLFKPKSTLEKLLRSKFVLYDYPFVKVATPVSFAFAFPFCILYILEIPPCCFGWGG